MARMGKGELYTVFWWGDCRLDIAVSQIPLTASQIPLTVSQIPLTASQIPLGRPSITWKDIIKTDLQEIEL